ncbi:MAG: GvpL/GvpF family gas vesicle protein [Bacteroidota bacterium]
MEHKIYLYGTVKTDQEVTLGANLSTNGAPQEIKIHVNDGLGIAYALRDAEEDEVAATRKNLVAHQKVTERLMEQYGVVLPFSFGTLLNTMEEVNDLLNERRKDFHHMFNKIEGKVELTLKMMWEKMDPVFAEIVSESEEIQSMRAMMAEGTVQQQSDQIALGKMVEDALLTKKEQLCQQAIAPLLALAVDHKIQKNITEAMFVNVNFLVKKEDEAKFDEIVNTIGESYSENTLIKYIGPAAPVNFL